jgi:hypothetical protein
MILRFSLKRAACRRLLTVVTDSPRKVAMRALVDEEQRRRLAQRVWKLRDRGKRRGGLSALFDYVVSRLLVAPQLFGFSQRDRIRTVAPKYPKRLMPDVTPEPARKGSGFGEGRKRQPRRNERLLHDVLGLLEIANVSQRRAEGEKLEASRQIHEGELVAFDCPAHEVYVIHCHALSHQGARKGDPPLRNSAALAGMADLVAARWSVSGVKPQWLRRVTVKRFRKSVQAGDRPFPMPKQSAITGVE